MPCMQMDPKFLRNQVCERGEGLTGSMLYPGIAAA